MKAWPNKDPDEVLDYEFTWSKRLDGDTILSSTWTVPSGLTEDRPSTFTSTTTVIWLAGGELGKSYVILNRIVTSGGRTMDQSAKIRIKAK